MLWHVLISLAENSHFSCAFTPMNRDEDRTAENREGRGKAGASRRTRHPDRAGARPAKAHNEKGLQQKLQAFVFPGAEGQN